MVTHTTFDEGGVEVVLRLTMSRNNKLNRAIRARMARTGETYSTARMHELSAGGREDPPVASGAGPGPAEAVEAEDTRHWRKFREKTVSEWEKMLQRLFAGAIPDAAEWTTPASIASVLELIGKQAPMNHLFYPEGGGNDLCGAVISKREQDCIEFDAGLETLVRPRALKFFHVGPSQELSFFRLHAAHLEPSGVYKRSYGRREEVYDEGHGPYHDRSWFDYGRPDDQPHPTGVRPLARYFSGAFVIVQKTSPFNHLQAPLDAYSGYHEAMLDKELLEFMSLLHDRAMGKGRWP
jgi:hypothetical protein